MVDMSILEKILRGTLSVKELPNNFAAILATRLDEAACSETRKELENMSDGLSGLFETLFKATTDEVRNAIRDGEGELYDAYVIGLVSFAQLFAAQAMNIRVDDKFQGYVLSEKYRPYFEATKIEGRSLDFLINKLNLDANAVRHDLGFLVNIGAMDFTKHGWRDAEYYPTPAARSVLSLNN